MNPEKKRIGATQWITTSDALMDFKAGVYIYMYIHNAFYKTKQTNKQPAERNFSPHFLYSKNLFFFFPKWLINVKGNGEFNS